MNYNTVHKKYSIIPNKKITLRKNTKSKTL
jgi:hypothetical protein